MPKYRWATEERHGYWYATRREAMDWAEHQKLATRDPQTGRLVLAEGGVVKLTCIRFKSAAHAINRDAAAHLFRNAAGFHRNVRRIKIARIAANPRW